MKKSCEGTSKLERKTVEKNRRLHMKSLCFKLSSLIPRDTTTTIPNPKEGLTQQEHLDEATEYIKRLQERIEELKSKKQGKTTSKNIVGRTDMLRFPMIEIRDMDSTLEVVLVCGLDKRFVFYELICVLEEEGAEVVNATSSIVGDKIFYTIHSHIVLPRIGLEASRVSERIRNLVE